MTPIDYFKYFGENCYICLFFYPYTFFAGMFLRDLPVDFFFFRIHFC